MSNDDPPAGGPPPAPPPDRADDIVRLAADVRDILLRAGRLHAGPGLDGFQVRGPRTRDAEYVLVVAEFDGVLRDLAIPAVRRAYLHPYARTLFAAGLHIRMDEPGGAPTAVVVARTEDDVRHALAHLGQARAAVGGADG